MADSQNTDGMDDFVRRYLYILLGIAVAGIIWWLSSLDFRVSELNDLLEQDAELAAYPYTFKVISLDNGVAEISSPRSAQMSAIQSLRIMYPELCHASAVSDEMMAAQEELARVQSQAGKFIGQQQDVRSVRWTLDTRWLAEYGVYVQD